MFAYLKGLMSRKKTSSTEEEFFMNKINGVKVYSSVSPNSISGNRVKFPCGSWCDVETKEKVEKKGTVISFTPISGNRVGRGKIKGMKITGNGTSISSS